MKNVVEGYYQEDNKLTINKVKKIEFVTTVKALDAVLPEKAKILDCASGTGNYAFYYADRGYGVTALDITPRHIDFIEEKLKSKDYTMEIGVNDATDLSRFDDAIFDIVLCMGPIYHLTEKTMRDKCLSECIRVLKKGGILVTSYINRFYVFPYVVTSYGKFLNKDLAKTLVETGVMKKGDSTSFWTDSYYSTPEETEADFQRYNLTIIDHLATDGLSKILRDKIDRMSEEEFRIWCDYHYSVCREKSILGASNHGLVIGRK
ncbi:MAG: SAM-dependent methyltransferase [Clostridiales bacterium]|jgi:ubiquinone/menaquinone biosynthesis C-methylase UbiE|nr:SAM-dependent methyltransferase [Clostridiales bacterium]